MTHRRFASILLLLVASLSVAGCATARPRHADPAATPENPQVVELQNQLAAKDQQIQDLQYQLDQRRGGPSSANFTSSSGTSPKIRVSGVSISEVQTALERAGFDPGPVDGKMGKKTRAAIKAFQRAHGLKADGVIGDRTWKMLQA